MLSTLKIVKVKPQPFFKRKKNVPFEHPEKPFNAPYKIHVMVDDKEYVSSKSSMEISVTPGERNIKISNKSFKFAAVKNILGEVIQWVGGDRDAFLVGEYLKFDASDVLSIKGANILFQEDKTLIVYVVNYGSGLDIVGVEEE